MEAERQHAKKASPLTLLEILARQPQKSLPLFNLQEQSGMEPTRYGEALINLRNAGYLEFKGEGFDGVIWLTPSGEEVVRLARPA